jgi:hypothetical protein
LVDKLGNEKKEEIKFRTSEWFWGKQ